MIIDVHGHYGYTFFPIVVEEEDEIVRYMDVYGIDKCIVSSFRGIFYELDNANHEVMKALKKYPGRLYGYIVANPNYPERSVEEIEYYSSVKGFVGVKIHPAWHGVPVDSDLYEPIFNSCERLGLPILAHSFVSEFLGDQVSAPERLARVAHKYKMQIVMGHMGGNSRRGIRAAKGLDNLFVEISGGRQDADSQSGWNTQRVEEAVKELGADKVMFGSDLPLVEPGCSLGIMDDADLDKDVKEMVMCSNAQRVFAFNARG